MGLVVFHLQATLFYLELLTKIHSWMILVGSWGCSSQHLGSFCSLPFSSLTFPHTFMKHLLSSRQGGRKENRHFIIQHRSWTQGRRGGIWGMGRYMSESSIPSFSLFTDSYRRYPCLSTDADIFFKVYIFKCPLHPTRGSHLQPRDRESLIPPTEQPQDRESLIPPTEPGASTGS